MWPTQGGIIQLILGYFRFDKLNNLYNLLIQEIIKSGGYQFVIRRNLSSTANDK